MTKEAAEQIGSGMAWLGFWLAIGLANFGEEPATVSIYDQTVSAVKSVVYDDDEPTLQVNK
jgi:hypothetical protein